MNLLPEWAPNIHPLLVHFPIALLFTAVLLDAIALLFRKKTPALQIGAVIVYVLGALGALAAFFTGREAADSVQLPAAAQTILTEHADLGTWTVWFFGIYALVRIGVLLFDKKARVALWLPLLFVGAGGLFLVWETAEHGAQMVFQHGVGVQVVEVENPVEHEHDDNGDEHEHSEADSAATATPTVAENGSWTWQPTGSAKGMDRVFNWLSGSGEAASIRTEGDRGSVLALQPADTPQFFVYDQPLASLQADVLVNLDDFDGSFRLTHHVQDADTYGFLAIEDGMMKQGRVDNGEMTVMEEKPFTASGWQTLRVVADKTHFRGYADGTLITHGHGDAPAPGTVGLRLDGTGIAFIKSLDVQSLR